ncbi:transcriptional regulator, AsnC family [Thermosyntropha lipolytica DSM 11003]|uniref:siroheme decarboxylase n=1 Tax=Thermosyntropha lipolytica DSM 11003 TaxID=1123382 RepID=A0A1M5NJW6_9FIRM|nr:AsnC family transcriptional regulator [Thermosyntropha lipolytica]SHG89489.1 transcriptional regulator, AsnC family [Thermosyntropha lipolytica DSM 11003]
MELTRLDKEILNILQNDFPLVERPYAVIADRLGISEEEVLARVKVLKEEGVIRRIGGVIDAQKLGFYSTLCACHVEEDKVWEAAGIINQEKGVTHNYLRDDWYNLWFTLTSPSPEEGEKIIKDLEKRIGAEIKSMPAQKVYKIKAVFTGR